MSQNSTPSLALGPVLVHCTPMGAPLAYFITWTCYATWLHGDERGSHTRGGDTIFPNRPLHISDAAQVVAAPMEFGTQERAVILETIKDHCAIRGWHLLAANVRTNHVHVVLQCPVSPETAMTQFKAWCTRRLREAGCFNRKNWTRHGSTVYLWTADEVDEKVFYVEKCQ